MSSNHESQLESVGLERVDHPMRKRFLFFRGNHRHFFGDAPGADYEALFQRHLSLKEEAPKQYDTENLAYAMANYRIIDDYGALPLATSQAVMVSSFHYGAYNLLGGFLLNEGVKFSVLANGAKYFEQMKAYQTQKAEANELVHGPVVLTESDVINPRDFSNMIQMMQKVRQGNSMLVYADGLEGQGGYFDRNRMERVPFLGREIYARQGTASLAYKLKLPIVFAMVESDAQGFAVRFFPVLYPSDYSTRDSFVRAYCELSYLYLERYVKAAPELWEIFDRLHIWLPKDTAPATTQQMNANWSIPEWCSYNEDRFGIFQEDSKSYLLDSHNLDIMAISNALALLLQRIKVAPGKVISEILPPSILSDLFQRGILIKENIENEVLAA
ncbi:hypothetical protein QWY85_09055 [Neolewinella lacunae]|uniref:Uncharacterized protein n=1 Tax=Neolewinella lacunae TaxID=1517758 RepID=A0A923PRW7_9BACT|nr:hypothetical protein [Neolewinella lacunae]MBC6996631.1 hypothetical protein [Neolewinella lacunae]MDN3634805.1 hypothetical protein [Neolewinella lacunae]